MKIIRYNYPKALVFFSMLILLTLVIGCGGVTPTTYTITSTAGAGGSITPEGAITIAEGENQTFTITPDEGYLIEDVLVDGASEGAVSTYSFQNIQQDHTIQASFVGVRVYNTDTGVDYDTIQEAIDAAQTGETIIVYPGTYDENILFNDKDITVSSTNPSDPAIVAATIIDGGGNDSVVRFTGGDISTLEGFTIQNGNANYGGGIFVYWSYPTITGNVITDNTANVGGGISMYYSNPTINGNTITGNEADAGGGIGLTHYSTSTINGNYITGNMARLGGGFYMSYGYPTITDNTITGNTTDYGGGIYMTDSSPTIRDNHITFNTANLGGGIFVNSGSPIIGGASPSDTGNFNTICGNDPDQIDSINSYPNNYISSACMIN